MAALYFEPDDYPVWRYQVALMLALAVAGEVDVCAYGKGYDEELFAALEPAAVRRNVGVPCAVAVRGRAVKLGIIGVVALRSAPRVRTTDYRRSLIQWSGRERQRAGREPAAGAHCPIGPPQPLEPRREPIEYPRRQGGTHEARGSDGALVAHGVPMW